MFKEQIAVGSIKSNIGHLKAAAGCAGMLKVILALKHKVLPRHINVKCPPDVDIQNSALYINMDNRPWFHDPKQPRRAGVSAFGFGGANYHAVLEEYESEQTKPYRLNRMPEAVLLVGSNVEELASICENELQKLRGDVAGAYFDEFEGKFKLQGKVALRGPRVGFVTAGGVDECIVRLEGAVKRLT